MEPLVTDWAKKEARMVKFMFIANNPIFRLIMS